MPNLPSGIKFYFAEEGDEDSMNGETAMDDIARLIENVANQVQCIMKQGPLFSGKLQNHLSAFGDIYQLSVTSMAYWGKHIFYN